MVSVAHETADKYSAESPSVISVGVGGATDGLGPLTEKRTSTWRQFSYSAAPLRSPSSLRRRTLSTGWRRDDCLALLPEYDLFRPNSDNEIVVVVAARQVPFVGSCGSRLRRDAEFVHPGLGDYILDCSVSASWIVVRLVELRLVGVSFSDGECNRVYFRGFVSHVNLTQSASRSVAVCRRSGRGPGRVRRRLRLVRRWHCFETASADSGGRTQSEQLTPIHVPPYISKHDKYNRLSDLVATNRASSNATPATTGGFSPSPVPVEI